MDELSTSVSQEEDFDEFLTYVRACAFGSVSRQLRRRVSESDLVQETMVNLLQAKQNSKNAIARRLPFAQRVFRNTLARTLRRCFSQKRDLQKEQETLENEDSIRGSHDTPSQLVSKAEIWAGLRAIVRTLPEPYQDVIRWRIEEQCTFKEIGSKLDKTEEVARKLWERAIAALRSRLGTLELSRP